jgi:hypothetical protein
MFAVTLLGAVAYTVVFILMYYLGLFIYKRRVIRIEPWKLTFYITLFCVFGLSGEILVNTIWNTIFSSPLWEYQLFPTHSGDISYFFIFIWGGLGYYRYLNDTVIHRFKDAEILKPALIMGAEAILLELAYNGFFFLLFRSYIFYYLPGNLGIFSHISCLQVIPFYFIVGLFTSRIIIRENKIGFTKRILSTLLFYWMIILVLLFF